MLSNSQSKIFKQSGGSSGYFLFELMVSALIVVAIAVLAFPTYQDFAPHYEDVDKNSSVIEPASNEGAVSPNEPNVSSDHPVDQAVNTLAPTEEPAAGEDLSGH